ncbi:MAG: D-alanine--D-alanine ligase [Candidatus Hydrogenedentes bacterium]|nr:D-alanine--D-alanine ligase [Candidatus Hydrogenedentota bacterium]
MNSADRRIRVAVVFGGDSPEHEVSVISGTQVIAAMDQLRFEVIPVYIAQNGLWYTGKELADKTFFSRVAQNPAILESCTQVALLPVPGQGGLTTIAPKPAFSFNRSAEARISVDVFFPVLHGGTGENGSIQGLFELASVAYAGSNVPASAVGMDKGLCKKVAQAHGIPVLPGLTVGRSEARANLRGVLDAILSEDTLGGFPLFVKPCNLGSSIGVSACNNESELAAGLVRVFKYDTHAIVEPKIQDIMELNVAVLEGEPPTASVVEMPRPDSKDGVLSYEDKYMRGGKTPGDQGPADGMAGLDRVIDPQDIATELKEAVRAYAAAIFTAIHAHGVARVDFIVDKSTQRAYFNEINTIPGSLAFYLFNENAPYLFYTEQLSHQIDGALKRHAARRALQSKGEFKAIFSG